MKSKSILVLVAIILCIGFTKVQASHYDWNDGGTHNLDYIHFDSGSVYNNTTVNILDYGEIDPSHLDVYDTSKVNVLSSTAEVSKLNAYDNSIITISNGTVGLNCWGSSMTTISGGLIKRGDYGRAVIPIFESSKLNIYGGFIMNDFALSENGILTIYGSDFAIDGESIAAGSILSVLGGLWDDEPLRHLTGILDNGGVIDNDIQIGGSASIVLVPEPSMFFLLSLGCLVLRRKK